MHAPRAHTHPGHARPLLGTPQILRDVVNEWAVRILLECIITGHN